MLFYIGFKILRLLQALVFFASQDDLWLASDEAHFLQHVDEVRDQTLHVREGH